MTPMADNVKGWVMNLNDSIYAQASEMIRQEGGVAYIVGHLGGPRRDKKPHFSVAHFETGKLPMRKCSACFARWATRARAGGSIGAGVSMFRNAGLRDR